MSEPFLAEIRILPYNFAPYGWALCNGQLMPIQQNPALFSLLGTTYGGNGMNNFGLPNLQGCAPMHPGNGPGLTTRVSGEQGGSANVTLTSNELPGHTHQQMQSGGSATVSTPDAGTTFARSSAQLYAGGSPTATAIPQALQPAGGNQPHNNLQPYQAMNFCIALQGIFPPRP